MSWGLIADEDKLEKNLAYKLYFYFSGLSLNIFLMYLLVFPGKRTLFKIQDEMERKKKRYLKALFKGKAMNY